MSSHVHIKLLVFLIFFSLANLVAQPQVPEDIPKALLDQVHEIEKLETQDPMIAVPSLFKFLRNQKKPLRVAAMKALRRSYYKVSQIQQQQIAESIAILLSDISWDIRKLAAHTLVSFGDYRAAGVLWEQLLYPRHYQDLRIAVELLGKLTGQDWSSRHIIQEEGSNKIVLLLQTIQSYLQQNRYPFTTIVKYRPYTEHLRLLEKLFTYGLFDPMQAQRVKVIVRDNCHAHHALLITTSAWLTQRDAQPVLILNNLHEVTAPTETEKSNFVTEANNILLAARNQSIPALVSFSYKNDVPYNPTLKYIFWAAWLHRLGHDDLAMDICALVPDSWEEILEAARKEMAWQEFHQAVSHYLIAADQQSQRHLERLHQVYPDLINRFGPGFDLLQDINRRHPSSNFENKQLQNLPDAYASWTQKQQIAYLIDNLQEFAASFRGVLADPYIKILVECGEPAIEPLLDCMERDKRLTRTLHNQNPYYPEYNICTVREVALLVVVDILQLYGWCSLPCDNNVPCLEANEWSAMVTRIRQYWQEQRSYSFAERMMNILTNPEVSREARRDAVYKLVQPKKEKKFAEFVYVGDNVGSNFVFNSDLFTTKTRRKGKWQISYELSSEFQEYQIATWFGPYKKYSLDETRLPLVALEKITNPTVTEALLPLMEEDLQDDGTRSYCLDFYMVLLIALGDNRIVPQLIFYEKNATDMNQRRKLAYTLSCLGYSKALNNLATEFASGKITAPKEQQQFFTNNPGLKLYSTVCDFMVAGSSECQEALRVLFSDPQHPYHNLLLKEIFQDALYFGVSFWSTHPLCIKILETHLDNTANPENNITYQIEGEYWAYQSNPRLGNFYGKYLLPAYLKDPTMRREYTKGRICDLAAMALVNIVWGLPPYHPLMLHNEERLSEIRVFLKRYGNVLRPATSTERQMLQVSENSHHYIPEIMPITTAATNEDVVAGRAVFCLGGIGQVVNMQLPAVGILHDNRVGLVDALWGESPKNAPGYQLAKRVLIVQAEKRPDGKKCYGIIEHYKIRMAEEDEFSEIMPFVNEKK